MKYKGKINHEGKDFDEKFAKCKSDDLPMFTTLYRMATAVIAPSTVTDSETEKEKVGESIRVGYGLSLISSVSVFTGIHAKKSLMNPSFLVEALLDMAKDEQSLIGWADGTGSIIANSTTCICPKCFNALEKRVLNDKEKAVDDSCMAKVYKYDKKTKKGEILNGEDLPPEVIDALESMIANNKKKEGK